MARTESYYAVVGVKCVGSTDKALQVRVPSLKPGGPSVHYWVPKSQLHPEDNEIIKFGDEGILVVKEWLAKEKGWT